MNNLALFFHDCKAPDWSEHDKRRYSYRQDLLSKARSLGFQYISEATALLYIKHGSIREVAVRLKVSTGFVQKHLKRIGVKVNSRGGPNHVKGKAGRKKAAVTR